MSIKLGKRILSFAAAAMLSCTSMAARATEVGDIEYVSTGGVDDTVNWDIDDYADNIKAIYKIDYPEQADVIDGIVDGFLTDSEFIGIFENIGGSAFLIVEDSLRHTLDPDTTPLFGDGDLYYTDNEIPLIKQKSGYDDGAAAAVLMALYGCGKYTYPNSDAFNNARQNALIDEISWDSNNETTIGEITRTMRRYFTGSNGFDFQTKYYTYKYYNDAIRALATGLSMNTAPVVRFSDGNRYYYGVVKQLEFNEGYIRLIDPRTGTTHDIIFDDFETMINNNKGIWMSVYAPDKSEQAIEQVKSEYPAGKYYTKNKDVCTYHNDFDNPDRITCLEYDGGWQCAGFARYVFKQVKDRTYTSSRNSNITGFGKQNLNAEKIDDDDSFEGITLTEQSAKKYLQGLPTGTYVRVETPRTRDYYWHSFSVLSTSDTDITIYQANYNGNCLVSIVPYTWSDLVKEFPRLLYYVD